MKTGTDPGGTRDAEWKLAGAATTRADSISSSVGHILSLRQLKEPSWQARGSSDISQWRLYQQVRKLGHGTTLLRKPGGHVEEARTPDLTTTTSPAALSQKMWRKTRLPQLSSWCQQPDRARTEWPSAEGSEGTVAAHVLAALFLWQLSSGISTFNTSFGKTTPLMSDPTAALWPELQHAICVGLVLPLEAATAHARAMGRRQEAGNFCDHERICVLSSTALTASEMSFHLLWSVSHY